jgi:hypothetical protein
VSEAARELLVDTLVRHLVDTQHTDDTGMRTYAGPEIGHAWIRRIAERVVDEGWRPPAAADAHTRELEAAVDRIRAFHSQDDDGLLAPGRWCPGCGEPTPCRTIRVLNGVVLPPGGAG